MTECNLQLRTEQNPSALDLLSALMGFHAKTRTLPSYINAILECLSLSHSGESQFDSPRLVYRSVSASPLMDGAHLQELSAALRTFSTPGQTPALAEATLASLETAWGAFDGSNSDEHMDVDSDEIPKKKKRRKGNDSGQAQAATSFASTARVTSVVLASLPLDTLTATDQGSVISMIINAKRSFLANALRLEGSVVEWPRQLVTASALRLMHAIIASPKLKASIQLEDDGCPPNLVSKVRGGGILAELTIENVRLILLRHLQFTNVRLSSGISLT